MDIFKEARREVVAHGVRHLRFRIGAQLSPWTIVSLELPESKAELQTHKEQSFSGVQKLVFHFRVGNRIEPADANDLLDSITASIIGIQICSQNSAQECLEPESIRGHTFVSSLIDAVTLQTTGNFDLHPHVEV